MAGAWTLTDEGEFILNEPYATQLAEAKHAGSVAWQNAVYDFLAERTGYDPEYIADRFVHKACNNVDHPVDAVDEFIIQALEGEL